MTEQSVDQNGSENSAGIPIQYIFGPPWEDRRDSCRWATGNSERSSPGSLHLGIHRRVRTMFGQEGDFDIMEVVRLCLHRDARGGNVIQPGGAPV